MSRWTKEEERLLTKHYPSLGAKSIKFLPHRSENNIRSKAFNMGLKFLKGPGVPHDSKWYDLELARKEIDHIPLEDYKGYDVPILHECFKQGHITKRSPNNVLRGSECIICANNQKRNTDNYIDLLVDKDIEYIPLEDYVNTDTPILHKCPECNHQWKVRPSTILRGGGCTKCNRVGGYSFTLFENNPTKASEPGICYLVVLVDKKTNKKIAYKIGITKGKSDKDILKRIKHFKGYEVRILKSFKGTLLEVFTREQALHKKWKKYQLIPDKKFGGMYECFELRQEIVKTFPNL